MLETGARILCERPGIVVSFAPLQTTYCDDRGNQEEFVCCHGHGPSAHVYTHSVSSGYHIHTTYYGHVMRWVLQVNLQGCPVSSFRHTRMFYTCVGLLVIGWGTSFQIIARLKRAWQSSCDVLTCSGCLGGLGVVLGNTCGVVAILRRCAGKHCHVAGAAIYPVFNSVQPVYLSPLHAKLGDFAYTVTRGQGEGKAGSHLVMCLLVQ